jgi:hypothetical protein
MSFLISLFQFLLSFDKLDWVKVNEFFEKTNANKELLVKTGITNSNVILFFLTNKFVKTDKFKEEWSKRDKTIIIVYLLEKLDMYLDFNLSEFFVSNLYDTLSLVESEEIIQKNKVFMTRLINLTKINTNKKHDVILNKYSINVSGNSLERMIIGHIELIDDEVIVKTTNKHNIDKIMIMNWKMAKTVGMIGNLDIIKQEFCWIKHLNQIFCYQKDKSKLIKEAKCSLFSKAGNLIKSVFSIDNEIHEVNSIFYNRSNLHVYLNLFDKSCSKRSTVTLNEEFNLINIIDENLFNPQFSLNYFSEIQLMKRDYKIFHYDSNIAFIYLIDGKKNFYIFDKSSYSIVDSFQTDNRLIMVLGDKMLFRSRNCYLIQKVPSFLKPDISFDSDQLCKLNPFKKPHLLSNPYFLPCGNAACLQCIYKQYNLHKHTLKCEACNEVHRLPQMLEPYNKPTDYHFVQKYFNNVFLKENRRVISELGIINYFS